MSTPFLIFFWHFLNLFHLKAIFWGVKAAFFLDIAGKMQSLGLLHLIEKFAEIHRQVSLRSLTTISWRAFVCFFGLNPFQLQNASHSALKLHFSFWNGGTLGCRPSLLGASPQTPARNFVPCTLSPLRGIELGFSNWKNLRDTTPQAFFFYGYHFLFEMEINPSS